MEIQAESNLGSGLPGASTTVRGIAGGVLMGLANLVPGISGGTMLLAAGVYPAFVDSIAELSTLKLRVRPVAILAIIAGSALLAILLLAGLMKSLVIEHRWAMYSLFIGLTLGGVPLVWRLARPATPGLVVGALVAFLLMAIMAFGGELDSDGSARNLPVLFLSGLAGASAMILPGVSGGYLLLLLGQYENILGAVDQVKRGLLASGGPDVALLLDAAWVVAPVGLGVVAGVVGVSNGLRWLLRSYEKPTLGALLGLLFGAVVGLWPFYQPVAPQAGDVVNGEVLTATSVAEVDLEDWRVERFDPSGTQVAGAIGLVLFGLGATLAVDRIGGSSEEDDSSTPAHD